MRFIGMVIFFFVTCNVVSQSPMVATPSVPPSPNASALVRFTNLQVGHYTGVPNISIPLGELPGRDISISISLDYHASGIKVQDVASSVGLGWNLSAGGAITRVVRGIPDGVEENCLGGPGSYWTAVWNNCDFERDVFYFSFQGRTGKMFLDNTGTPQTMPYQDIEIAAGLSGTTPWIITDERGYKYYFGENAAEREETTYYTGHSSTGYEERYTYISTWYLNKIVSPIGIQVATFTYSTGSDVEYVVYNQQGVKESSSPLLVENVDTKVKIKQAKYLTTIGTSIGSVQLSYLNNRDDLTNGWQLSAVNFRDQSNLIKRKFYLVLDYFKAALGTVNDRLRLSSIKEGIQNPVTTYSFTYHEVSDNPFRSEFRTDHYGYYNKVNNNCNPWWRLSSITCGPNGVEKGTSTLNDIQVFALYKVEKIGGGRTDFEYEHAGRGLRVKSISNFDGEVLSSKSTYMYSGGQGNDIPIYKYTTEDGAEVISSTSYKDLFDLNGVTFGYSTVTETLLDGSKIVREFTNFLDAGCSDTPPVVAKYRSTGTGTPAFVSTMDENGVPFALQTTKFWMRGLPKRISVYDNQNHLLKKDTMMYQEGPVVSTVENTALHLYKFKQPQSSPATVTYISGNYFLESRPVYLMATKSYVYDQNGYSNFIVDKSTYSYHTLHKTFPVSVIRQVGSGPEEKVTFRYPRDIVGHTATQPTFCHTLECGLWSMITNHQIEPIEKVSWFKDIGASYKITGAELKTFRKNAVLQRPALNAVYSLAISDPITTLSPDVSLSGSGNGLSWDSRYRLLSTYNIDDPTGTLISVQGSDGLTTNYEWFNSTLPSATTIGSGALVFRKEYTSNSILGLLQSTDENDQIMSVEYESNLGRPRLIRDHDSNIVTRYRYNNKDDNVSMPAGSITVSGCQLVNQGVNFYSSISTEYGQTKYEWDFGDGSNGVTTSGFVYHVYSSVGSYTVSVKRTNPEYFGESVSSMTVQITNPISNPSICVNGTISYDVCGVNDPENSQCIIEESMVESFVVPPGGITQPTFFCFVAGSVSSYQWQYQLNGGSWISFGTPTSSTTGLPGYGGSTVGTYLVRCILFDACGNNITSSNYTLNAYASSSGCL